jgi:hypothetical protein
VAAVYEATKEPPLLDNASVFFSAGLNDDITNDDKLLSRLRLSNSVMTV